MTLLAPWGAVDALPYSKACPCSGPLQGCVQKWFVLGREASVLGTVSLPGLVAYQQEEQDAAGSPSWEMVKGHLVCSR